MVDCTTGDAIRQYVEPNYVGIFDYGAELEMFILDPETTEVTPV